MTGIFTDLHKELNKTISFLQSDIDLFFPNGLTFSLDKVNWNKNKIVAEIAYIMNQSEIITANRAHEHQGTLIVVFYSALNIGTADILFYCDKLYDKIKNTKLIITNNIQLEFTNCELGIQQREDGYFIGEFKINYKMYDR